MKQDNNKSGGQPYLPDADELPHLAKNSEAKNKKLFSKLKRQKPKNLDAVVGGLHDEVFGQMDCLECANCCRTTGPLLKEKDISRLSKHLKMKPGDFASQYLRIDEDGDYVFKSMPCPFLAADNYCMVYENRPEACRDYPHTHQRKFHRLLNITLKNTFVCPAVYRIVEEMHREFA